MTDLQAIRFPLYLWGEKTLLQLHHQNATVRVVAAAGGVPCILNGIRREIVGKRLDLVSLLKSCADVVALSVNRRIDLVCDFSVALIFLEPDVVRACAHPYVLPVVLKRRFPDAEMMAAGRDCVRLGLLVAEILHASE